MRSPPSSIRRYKSRTARLRRETMVENSIHYEIILYWSREDQAFIAEVPELPGCAADGATYQEAVANAEVVIREWIETAKELGLQVPEPRGRLMYA
jgi:predicted RNase H-like HicB family nuclease